MAYTKPDWSKAPIDAEAGIGEKPGHYAAWYRRDNLGEVVQICAGAQLRTWTWMGGRKDFPVGHELRPNLRHHVLSIKPWDGEGLPPVGTTCEWFDIGCGRWLTVSVAYRSSWVIVLRDSNPHPDGPVEISKEISSDSDLNPKLRPIRTPEQIAAEERNLQILGLADDLAGYQDREAGVKHIKIAEYLYENGYRKQVAP